MKFHIVTIFPDFFHGPLDYGIVRRAREAGLIDIQIHDLRSFTHDKHQTVDDRPFGGGEGMVLKPEPIFDCVDSLGFAPRAERINGSGTRQSVILLSAQGRPFNQKLAAELTALDEIALICGRYEGVDERVNTALADREISIGDYVLSGGELGAAVILDTVTRLLPGALGNEASSQQESFTATAACSEPSSPADSTCSSGGLLDYPHFTRPAEFRGLSIPEILISGDHERIRRWRRRSALAKTFHNRPDLLTSADLGNEDRQLLEEIQSSAQSSENPASHSPESPKIRYTQ